MIDILALREKVSEIVSQVNDRSDKQIDRCILTVDSAHLVKQLKNATGISLAVTYPTAKADGLEDNYYDKEKCFLFVLQKLAPGSKSEEDQLLMYADLQRIMLLVRDVIRNRWDSCYEIMPEESFNIEWEYQVFGEHCGLSMSLEFKSYDRIAD